MKSRSASKIKLTSYEELVGASSEDSVEIDISKIRDFKNHPFRVVDDEKMAELVESIRENGVLTPVLIRSDGADGYEMVSGHRRRHAAVLAGLTTIPAIIRDMSDEEATVAMVDANIQREEILPSEKAFAYKMKMEAMKRQGSRSDLLMNRKAESFGVAFDSRQYGQRLEADDTSGQNDPKSEVGATSGQNDPKLEVRGTSGQDGHKLDADDNLRQGGEKYRTRELIARESGDSARQIQRYIRLTELIPELLDMVDNKKLKFVMAVEISYLDKRVQQWVLDYWRECGTLKVEQVRHLRRYLDENSRISQYKLMEVLNEGLRKKAEVQFITIPEEKVKHFFPESYNAEQKEKLIIMALEKWYEQN